MTDLNVLLSHWSVDDSSSVEPLTEGTNNLSYVVHAGEARYVLRVYQNTADPDRIRYEHAVLGQLSRMNLSFGVPAPIPADDGAALPAVPGRRDLVALFPFFPGEHGYSTELSWLRTCALALAELDGALAALTVGPAPRSLAPLGDFEHAHRSVPDPHAFIRSFPHPRSADLIRGYEELHTLVPELYATLPRQIIHGDLDGSNLLVVKGRVSAILDFEFSRPDLRVAELAIALCQCTVGSWASASRQEQIRAFAGAYLQKIPLTPAELEALTDAMRLYRMASFIHRAGRWREGHAQEQHVSDRADAFLRLEDWLQVHGREILTPTLPSRP